MGNSVIHNITALLFMILLSKGSELQTFKSHEGLVANSTALNLTYFQNCIINWTSVECWLKQSNCIEHHKQTSVQQKFLTENILIIKNTNIYYGRYNIVHHSPY